MVETETKNKSFWKKHNKLTCSARAFSCSNSAAALVAIAVAALIAAWAGDGLNGWLAAAVPLLLLVSSSFVASSDCEAEAGGTVVEKEEEGAGIPVDPP